MKKQNILRMYFFIYHKMPTFRVIFENISAYIFSYFITSKIYIYLYIQTSKSSSFHLGSHPPILWFQNCLEVLTCLDHKHIWQEASSCCWLLWLQKFNFLPISYDRKFWNNKNNVILQSLYCFIIWQETFIKMNQKKKTFYTSRWF